MILWYKVGKMGNRRMCREDVSHMISFQTVGAMGCAAFRNAGEYINEGVVMISSKG